MEKRAQCEWPLTLRYFTPHAYVTAACCGKKVKSGANPASKLQV